MFYAGHGEQNSDFKTLIRMNLQFFADGPGGEKTEEPTAKRLQDARKEGQVSKSQELITAAMLFSLFLTLRIFINFIANNFLESFKESYSIISVYAVERAEVGSMTAIMRQSLLKILITLLPVFAIAVIVAFFVNIFQVKWKVTAKPLKPKLEKISPLKGFKRMFSLDKVFDLLKATFKIILIFYAAYSSIIADFEKLKVLYEIDLVSAVVYIGNFILSLGMKIASIYLIIGVADFIYHYFKFKKDMKMTKQEVKDEWKQQEGDPQIKSRIKGKMREASRRRMMKSVPDADVVITNPTHYACAIKYDKLKSAAPVLTAKGADYLAAKIKEVAKEANVPIVENKALARMLYYNVDLDSEIPEELYQMTAEVLAYVYEQNKKAVGS